MDSQLKGLFPITFREGFTTSSSHFSNPCLTSVSLESLLHSATHKTTSSPPHPVITKDSKDACRAFYPKGSINPQGEVKGGFGMYVRALDEGSWREKMANAKEVMWSYRVMFQKDFGWAKGGKVPGVYGGMGESAYRCTGGRTEDQKECRCFNLRLMWRTHGVGELYAYLPPLDCNTRQLLAVPPLSIQNPDFGYSVGRGSFTFKTEEHGWNTIAQRVRLNDVGCENGEVEVFIDGTSVINVKGLILRTSDESCCKGLHFQTFFGGKAPEWASPCDQYAWFCDLSGAIVE